MPEEEVNINVNVSVLPILGVRQGSTLSPQVLQVVVAVKTAVKIAVVAEQESEEVTARVEQSR